MPEEGSAPFGAADTQAQDVSQLIAMVSHLTHAAMAFRQKKQLGKAVRQMERAVSTCECVEHGHPAIAVETARARLNLGAMLSGSRRHEDALAVVRQAQSELTGVLVWAQDCGFDDPGVAAIAEEARSLHCAALVAEAIELESLTPAQASTHPVRRGDSPNRETATAADAAAIAEDAVAALLHRQQLYDEARAAAEEQLPPAHPMTAFVKQLSVDGGAGRQGRTASAQPKGVSLPSLKDGPDPWEALVSRGDAPATEMLEVPADAGGGLLGDRQARPARSGSATRKANTATVPKAFGRPGDERNDMFSDFLRGIEVERTTRLNEKNPRLQDEAKRKLGQIHRSTQLLLELSDDDDLKNKRYSKVGHKVFMEALTKENKCRSDRALLQESKKAGTVPETLLVKKLFRQLYVKPPTPPPPPPPPKPKIELSLSIGKKQPADPLL